MGDKRSLGVFLKFVLMDIRDFFCKYILLQTIIYIFVNKAGEHLCHNQKYFHEANDPLNAVLSTTYRGILKKRNDTKRWDKAGIRIQKYKIKRVKVVLKNNGKVIV